VALSGEDGSFEIFLPPGRLALAVESRDAKREYGRQTIEIPDEEECSVDVDLAPMLSGVVVDKATGEGMAGVVFLIRRESGLRAVSDDISWQVTGNGGRFSLNIDPGDYVLRLLVKGYELVQVPVAVGSGPHPDLHLELVRGLAITGRVLFPSEVSQNVLPIAPQLMVRSADGRHTEQGEYNEDGSFSLGGLQPVPYSLCIGTRDLGWALVTGVEPGTDDVTLAFQAPGHLELTVRDPAGRPLEGAFATVVSVSKAPIVIPDQERGVSDATGRIRLAVPAGALEISIFSQAYKRLLEVEVEPAGTLALEVNLSEPSGLPR
jgi:hypothetical protein